MTAPILPRQKLVVGNWKMNGDLSSNARLLEALAAGLRAPDIDGGRVSVAVCPSFVHIAQAASRLQGSAVAWGAQDVAAQTAGAFTGEVSAEMLLELGCRWTLTGHSERRALFGETDAVVAAKTARALQAGLPVIVCVGETLEERESGVTEAVLGRQLDAVADLLSARTADAPELVVAYEPVWAIGTGRTASPEQAQAVHAFLRARAGAAGSSLRILYGGSVKAANAASLFAMPDIDGGLIGGAALVADDFLAICRAAAGTTESLS